MARILFAWELGGGLGHVLRAAPIMRSLTQRGHEVWAALRDLSRSEAVFGPMGVQCLQAPVKTSPPARPIPNARSFAHLLINNGFSEPTELAALAEAWRHVYRYVEPDLILLDHSPTALLAARAHTARRAVIGTGFCCPPNVAPLPGLRPWLDDDGERLKADEQQVLDTVNQILGRWQLAPLDRLGRLYAEVDETFLATFAELDHYPGRAEAQYWGVWPTGTGLAPCWPTGEGPRVFAYLKPFRALPALLARLDSLLELDYFATAARRFASRYAEFKPQDQIVRIADRIEQLAG